MLVLDAATGEIRHDHEFPLTGEERGSYVDETAALPEVRLLTSAVRVQPDGTDLVGYALESSEEGGRVGGPVGWWRGAGTGQGGVGGRCGSRERGWCGVGC